MKPLAEVVADNDHEASLKALRDRVAAQIDETDSARDVAALSNRLQDILTQLAEITSGGATRKGTALDELQERRAARGSNAARGNRAKK